MTIVEVKPGTCLAVPKISFALEATIDTAPIFNENLVVLDVDEWVALDSKPDRVGDYYANVALALSDVRPTLLPGALDPDYLDGLLGADARFIMRSAQVHTSGADRLLLPTGEAPGGAGPFDYYLQLESFLGFNDVEYDAATSPVFDEEYHYRGEEEETYRPALGFNGANSLATLTTDSSFAFQTFIFVFIPSRSPDGIGVVFDGAVNALDSDQNLQVTWSQGRLSIARNQVEWISHESVAPAGSPILVALSLEPGVDGTGLVLIDDGLQTSREFSYEFSLVAAKHMTPTFGGERTSASYPSDYDYERFADFDLLEVCYWQSAMGLDDLRATSALIAAAYGILP